MLWVWTSIRTCFISQVIAFVVISTHAFSIVIFIVPGWIQLKGGLGAAYKAGFPVYS